MSTRERFLSILIAPLVGAVGFVFALMADGVVLDSSFVPLRYAQRMGTGQGMALEGHSIAVEGFTDPLWVAVLGGLRALGIHEFKIQTYLGPGLVFVLLSVLSVYVLARQKKLIALIPVLLFGLWPPLAVSAGSASNSLWLATVGALSVMWVVDDIDRIRLRRRSVVAVVVLVSTGLPGLLIGLMLALMSGATLRKRLFLVVATVFMTWTFWRFLVFENVWPRALELRLETFSLASLSTAFAAAPTMFVLGLLGMLFGWGKGPCVRASAGAAIVWSLWACTGTIEEHSFFDVWVPVGAMLAVLGSHVWSANRTPKLMVFVGFLVIGSWSQLEATTAKQAQEINFERTAQLKQAQGMARFIRWRFLPEEWVAVHSPGGVPYHARRPFIDLSGTTEMEDVSPSILIKRSPSGILPRNNFVSTHPMRIPLDKAFREPVGKKYNQHAIQQQKKWKLVRAHPIWFHIYIRKDLPMLSPDISEEEGNQFPKTDTVEPTEKSAL